MNDLQMQLNRLCDRIAGLEAKDAARLKESADSERKGLSHAVLNRLTQELDSLIVEAKNSRPTSGTNESLPRMQREHGQKTKELLVNWLIRVRDEASKVSLAGDLGRCLNWMECQPTTTD